MTYYYLKTRRVRALENNKQKENTMPWQNQMGCWQNSFMKCNHFHGSMAAGLCSLGGHSHKCMAGTTLGRWVDTSVYHWEHHGKSKEDSVHRLQKEGRSQHQQGTNEMPTPRRAPVCQLDNFIRTSADIPYYSQARADSQQCFPDHNSIRKKMGETGREWNHSHQGVHF